MAAQTRPIPPAPVPGYLSEGGLLSWLTTIDHKRVAVLYGASAVLFFVVGGFEAMLIRTQLAVPNNSFLSAGTYNELFTMHATTMIFLAAMPFLLGFFANFLIPLQIGARDVAFPRLNALSFWLFIFSAIFFHLSWLWGGAPNAGWFGYANLTERYYSPGTNLDFWIIGLIVNGAASILTAVNFFVTILTLRAPGMTFMRMPMFCWSILVTSILVLLAFPALTVGLIFLALDRFYGTHFYEVAAGGMPVLWQHLFWLFGHPEVYILALPAFGIVSEVLPTFSRKPLFGYPMMAYSIVLIAFLSYGVWGHHMFAVGLGPVADSAFAVTSMLIAIPTGIKIFNWIATVWGGSLRTTAAFYFAVGVIFEFTIGGLSGVMHASAPIDLQQTDSYFVVAHLHYVLFGGVIFAIYAAIYYWWPKITGRMLNERLGKLHFWLTIVGFNGTFFPMHFLGMMGMPRRIYTYGAGLGWDQLNLLATICAYILGGSVIVMTYNFVQSLIRGPRATSDPWDGRSLEWSVASPPPEYNFATIPTVTSRDAFWVRKYRRVGSRGVELLISGAPHPQIPEPLPREPIHMPAPSLFPLLLAAGVMIAAIGAVTWLRIVWAGAALAILSAIGMGFQYADHGEARAHNAPSGGDAPEQIDSRKLGLWTFIGSECIFFASLIATYLVYKGRNVAGPDPREILNIPLTSVSTFVLLMSSLLMVLALAAIQRGDKRWTRLWLFGTAALGLVFLAGQVFEFTSFYREGLSLQTNLFGQTFYTLVGFHGAHVAIGVFWLLTLGVAALGGEMPKSRALSVELCGLYWHFVDVVWVVIFTLVYLMEAVH